MSDDALDPRTVQELRTYADGVIRPIDAMTIAETAIAGGRRSRVSRTTLVFLAAALILAVAATVAIEVGTRPSLVPLTTYRGVLVPAPDLLVPRGRPLLVPLADGRVLIAGGDAGFSTTTAEVFDPATGRAARPGAMVSADRLFLSSAVLMRDGRVLLFGDVWGTATDAPPVGVAQIFDPATMSFAEAGPMVTPLTQAKLALLQDGRVLVAGGTPADTTAVARAELFDPATGSFSVTGAMVTPRAYQSMTTLADGRVLVTGGDSVGTAEIYDPATGSFAPAGSAPQMKRIDGNLSVLLPDGRVVLFGQRNGSLGDGGLANGPATAFDPVTQTFRDLTTVPTSPGTATLLGDGRIFLTGWWGTTLSGNWSGIYDPANGRITETGTLRGWVPSAVGLADGRVLIVGGLEDGKLHGDGADEAPPVSSMQILE